MTQRGFDFTLAPRALRSTLLSRLMEAGIVRMSSYPLAAATMASPIPVLPDVGSTRTVLPEKRSGWEYRKFYF